MFISEQVQIELIRGGFSSFGFLMSGVAAWFSYLGLKQSKTNYHQVNSRMDQLLELKGRAGEAIGVERERGAALQRERGEEPPKE